MKAAEEGTFAGQAIDRAAHLRGSAGALLDRAGARVMPVWRGKPLCDFSAGDPRAGWCAPGDPALTDAGAPIFLGLSDGTPLFAADLSAWTPADLPETLGAFADPSEQHHPDLPGTHRFAELRAVMTRLDPASASIAATARGLFEWHRLHGFCARCGHPTEIAEGGWRRHCPSCGAPHFPRTDPVVMMLVTSGNDVLLGRAPGWPERMYSLLAGFVEPGETVEAAVRRETFEEAGIAVGRVSYLASQPWPFPASLMIGCRAEALGREITRDEVEIETARWVSREAMMAAYAGEHPDILPPRPGAIASFLLRHWLADTLD